MAIRHLKRAFFVLLLASLCAAEGTRTWQQSTFEELSKGTSNGVAIRSTGGMELAPSFKPLVTTPSSYIWAVASAPNGDVFAAAGSPARVYYVTPDGQATPIFEPQELQVQALVVDKSGVLYAATNPDGKVYRIERKAAAQSRRPPRREAAPRRGVPRFISSPAPNTSGTWPSTAPAIFSSPPATTAKSSASPAKVPRLSSSRATKPTFACWPSMRKAI